MANKKIPDGVIHTALMIDLPQFLRQQGIELKEFRTCWEYGAGAEKVTVWQDRRDGHYQWKRQYDGLSGNAIQWLLSFGGSRSFADAAFQLYDWAGGRPLVGLELDTSNPSAGPVEEKKKHDEFRLPPANKSFSRVMAYLCKTRKIDPHVVTVFHKAGLIYESSIYHNAVFVGCDTAGVARHANLRGTVTNEKSRAFKMNQEGSDPKYGFHWVGDSHYLFVFEAPSDVNKYKKKADKTPPYKKIVISDDSIMGSCKKVGYMVAGKKHQILGFTSRDDLLLVPVKCFVEQIPQQEWPKINYTDPHNLLSKYVRTETETSQQPKKISMNPDPGIPTTRTSYFLQQLETSMKLQHENTWNSWVQSKQVFLYEDSFAASILADSAAVERVECEVLRRCPYTSCYIEAQEQNGNKLTFFISLADNILRLLPVEEDIVGQPRELRIDQHFTCSEMLAAIDDPTAKDSITKMLQLYVCLCSAEMEDLLPTGGHAPLQTRAPQQADHSAGSQRIPSWDVNVYTVTMQRTVKKNYRRQRSSSDTGAAPRRPHKRRAHWHHFWIGSKGDETNRRRIVKWVSEIDVNPTEDDLPVRIILVKR